MFSQCDPGASDVWRPSDRIQPRKPASARGRDRSTAPENGVEIMCLYSIRGGFPAYMCHPRNWAAICFAYLADSLAGCRIVLFSRLHRNILTISINRWPSSLGLLFNTPEAPATEHRDRWFSWEISTMFLFLVNPLNPLHQHPPPRFSFPIASKYSLGLVACFHPVSVSLARATWNELNIFLNILAYHRSFLNWWSCGQIRSLARNFNNQPQCSKTQWSVTNGHH